MTLNESLTNPWSVCQKTPKKYENLQYLVAVHEAPWAGVLGAASAGKLLDATTECCDGNLCRLLGNLGKFLYCIALGWPLHLLSYFEHFNEHSGLDVFIWFVDKAQSILNQSH